MGYIDLPFGQDDRASRIVEAARRDVLRAEAEEAHAKRTRSLVRELARAFPTKGERIDMANEVPRHLLKAAPYLRADDEGDETRAVLDELRSQFPDRHERAAAPLAYNPQPRRQAFGEPRKRDLHYEPRFRNS